MQSFKAKESQSYKTDFFFFSKQPFNAYHNLYKVKGYGHSVANFHSLSILRECYIKELIKAFFLPLFNISWLSMAKKI